MCKGAIANCNEITVCVDLDGTLVRTNLLVEAIFILMRHSLLRTLKLPFWILRGKAYFKAIVARYANIDPALLPYNQDVIEYIGSCKADGRRIVLTTASNEKFAFTVAEHLGIFDDVFASNEHVNLSGATKKNKLVEEFGDKGFEYIADSAIDLPVWKHAGAAVLVGVLPSVESKVRSATVISLKIDVSRPTIRDYAKAVRLHQSLKNVLIFIPLLMSHEILNFALMINAMLAFASFVACSSSVYILNDLLDLENDRRHRSKCERGFDSGRIPLSNGLLMIPLLLAASVAIALLLPTPFIVVLSIYYFITLAYSLKLKRVVLVDILVLTGFYTLRVIAGGAATDIELSFWLLAFLMFLFFSLALVKRYSEILTTTNTDGEGRLGRNYLSIDLETLAQFGISSAYMSVLVVAFYINSDAVNSLYRQPKLLWFICPLLLYWISRVWLLTKRGEMHDDPIMFAIEDKPSHWVLIITSAIIMFASLGFPNTLVDYLT